MRISDGVKKYQEETKDRIFNSIIGIDTVSEETQTYSSVSRGRGSDENKEATSQKAAVRRDWTGLAAIAACAVMAVGVGTMMMKGSAPQPDNRSGTFTSENGSSEGSLVTTVVSEISDEESYYKYGMTFGDLLERSYEVVDLQVEERLPLSIGEQEAEGSIGSVLFGRVDYSVVCEYDVEKNGVVFMSRSTSVPRTPERYYRQYFSQEDLEAVNEGKDLPVARNGDKLLVFVKEGTESDSQIGYARVLTTQDSIYRFDVVQHKYVNIVSPGKFEDEVNEYVLDTLKGMTPSAVRKWTKFHRMSLVTIEEPSDSVPGGKIIDLEWDDDREAYVLTVSGGR